MVPLLGPQAGALQQRTAALALGEGGYLSAVGPLADLLERHATTPAFVARLTQLLSRLTGLELSVDLPQESVAQVRGWLNAHPLSDPYLRAP